MSLTKNDKKWISDFLSKSTKGALDKQTNMLISFMREFFVTKQEFKDALKDLPTRDEFFDRTDKLLGSQYKDEQELKMVSTKVYDDHEPRILALEETSD